jgi:hypothetical protein
MKFFLKRQSPPRATEKGLDQGPEMVRRVEITVEEEWVSGVVRRPTGSTSEAPPDGEQPIATYLELPPGTESN